MRAKLCVVHVCAAKLTLCFEGVSPCRVLTARALGSTASGVTFAVGCDDNSVYIWQVANAGKQLLHIACLGKN